MNEERRKEKFISKIVLELRPKSRRCLFRLFNRRENGEIHFQSIDFNQFQIDFLRQYENSTLFLHQYLQFNQLILFVQQIQYQFVNENNFPNTKLEFLFKGRPIQNSFFNEEIPLEKNFLEKEKEKLNVRKDEEKMERYYCFDCGRSFESGDLYIQISNWSRSIVCLSCFDKCSSYQCFQCEQWIQFQYDENDEEYLKVRYIRLNANVYVHPECANCSLCSKCLIGEKFHFDWEKKTLFCKEHFQFD